jgi:hypothetical protein
MGIPVIDTGPMNTMTLPEPGTAHWLAEIFRDIDFAQGAPTAS